MMRRQLRRSVLLMRWDWLIDLAFLASIVCAFLMPCFLLAPLAVIILSAFSAERAAANAANRILRSGLYTDLLLAGYTYKSMRCDIEAFAISRSWTTQLFNLTVLLFVLVGGVYSGHAAVWVLTSLGVSAPMRGIVAHGVRRGVGLGNVIGNTAVSIVMFTSAVFVFLLILASPLLLFLGLYMMTNSVVVGLLALIVGLHGVIIVLALRSGKPKPYGEWGRSIGEAWEGWMKGRPDDDDEIQEMLLARLT